MTVGNVTITPEELDQLAAKVSELLGTTAKDPSQWDEVTSLVGVTSLPVFKQVESMYSLVRVSLSVLKGVDGREISLQVNEDKTFIQWRYTDGMWQNLISVADLKGKDGKTPVFKAGATGIEWKYDSEPDTDYRVLVDYSLLSLKFEDLTPEQISQIKLKFSDLTEADKAELMKPALDAAKTVEDVVKEANTAIENANTAAGNANNAAANVQDGKTPVMQSVNAVSGSAPAGRWERNGTDAAGNPRYILNITLPQGEKGNPGLSPVFEVGTVTTVDPSSSADVDIRENGETPEGNQKYLIDFYIPQGAKGLPGTGSGNVFVDGTGLVIGKKYLFVPDSDGSTSGTFVEYSAPEIPEQVQPDWNATEGKGAILNKPGNATAEADGFMTSAEFVKLEKLNPSFLSNDVTGKKVEYTNAGKLLFEGKETFAVNASGELTLDGKKMSELGGGYLDLSPLFDAEGSPVTTTTDDFLAQVETAYVNHIGLAIIDGYVASMSILADETTYNITASLSVVSDNYLMRLNNNAQLVVYGFIITKADKSVSSALSLNELINTGDGTKFKSDDGTYKAIGAQYLDLSPLFDSEGNLVTVVTDEFLAQVEDAYNNRVPGSYANGTVNPLSIVSDPESYKLSSMMFIITSNNGNVVNDGILNQEEILINKTDKSVLWNSFTSEIRNTGDGTKFKSDDGTYKEVGGSDFVEIPFAVLELTNSSTSDQIKTAFGGDTAFDEIHQKIKSGKMAYCIFSVEESGITIAIPFIADGGVSAAETKTLQLMFINPLLQDPELASLTFIKSIADNTYTVMSVTNKLSYDLVTTVSNGLMSSADKKKLDRIGSYTTATTVANLNANYENIEISNLSANASLSVNLTGATYNGWEIFVAIYCSSARTITIPTTGNYISMIGSSLSCPAGEWTELHLKCTGGKWRIAKLEQQ